MGVPLEGGLGVVFLDWIWTKCLSLSPLPNPLLSLCAPLFFPTVRLDHQSSTPSFELSLVLTFVDYPSTCVSTRLHLLSPNTSFTSRSSLILSTDFFLHWCFSLVHVSVSLSLSLSPPMSFFMSSPLLSSSSLHCCHLLSLILSLSLFSSHPLVTFPITCPWSLSRNWAWPNSPLLRLMYRGARCNRYSWLWLSVWAASAYRTVNTLQPQAPNPSCSFHWPLSIYFWLMWLSEFGVGLQSGIA